jgi:hypothetical protein
VKLLGLRVGDQERTYRVPNAQPWQTQSVDFTAVSPETTVQFWSLDTEGGYAGPAIDDVAVMPASE